MPRQAPLYGAILIGIQALLITVQAVLQLRMLSRSSIYNDPTALLIALGLAACAWGLTIGALIHAYWPRPLPGDERGRRAWGNSPQIWSFYIVPTLVLALFPLALTLQNLRVQPSEQAVTQSVIRDFRVIGLNDNLMGNTCEPLQTQQLVPEQAKLCFYANTDGIVLVEKLKALTERLGMQLVDTKEWPIERQGNTLSGKVHLLAKGYGLGRRVPITLTYRGLVFVNRQEPLSATEQWLETRLLNGSATAYAELRTGHD